MPNRILRESILTSDGVNRLDAAGERFYRRLMSVVDDFGRFDGRPSIVRAACFPLLLDKIREADVQRWMAECQKAGLLVLYEADSKPYLWLLKLGEPRAKHSKYPAPPGKSLQVSVNTEPARTDTHAQTSVPYSYSYSNAPTSSDSKHMSAVADAYPPGLLMVWDAAPPKARERSSRVDCSVWWKKHRCEDIAETVLTGLEAWKASEEWTKDGGQFVPGLHRWLKARKWLEPPQPTNGAAVSRRQQQRDAEIEQALAEFEREHERSTGTHG